jgi:hypothetical protein
MPNDQLENAIAQFAKTLKMTRSIMDWLRKVEQEIDSSQ